MTLTAGILLAPYVFLNHSNRQRKEHVRSRWLPLIGNLLRPLLDTNSRHSTLYEINVSLFYNSVLHFSSVSDEEWCFGVHVTHELQLSEKYGPVFTFHLGPIKLIVQTGYRSIKIILTPL